MFGKSKYMSPIHHMKLLPGMQSPNHRGSGKAAIPKRKREREREKKKLVPKILQEAFNSLYQNTNLTCFK